MVAKEGEYRLEAKLIAKNKIYISYMNMWKNIK
jgi:hypothetical protein